MEQKQRVRSPYELLTALSFVRQYGREFLEQELEKNGIHGFVVSHGAILGLLYHDGPSTMQDIANKIGRRKSTVTVLVRKLIKAGYVFEQELDCPKDRRYKQIALSEKGEGVRGLFEQLADELNAKYWQGFSLEEQLFIMQSLAKLESNIRQAQE